MGFIIEYHTEAVNGWAVSKESPTLLLCVVSPACGFLFLHTAMIQLRQSLIATLNN